MQRWVERITHFDSTEAHNNKLHDLDADRHTHIEEWLNTLRTSTVTIRYIALPTSDIVRDKVSGRPIGRAFSCAGFVHCCFEEAIGIRLIALDALPEVNRDILLRIWRETEIALGRRYGIQGPGPWKIFLPSYLFHALLRGSETSPYHQPDPDPCFPPEGESLDQPCSSRRP